MPRNPMHVSELEKMIDAGCAVPECTHRMHDRLVMNQRCHPGIGVFATYVRGSTRVELTCARCQRPVCELQIAE